MLSHQFKDHPTQDYEQITRKRKLYSGNFQLSTPQDKQERRRTIQPLVSISHKPVNRVLNNVETASLRESLLNENFQLLCYYLSNILYTVLPVMEQASRFRVVRTGRFEYIDQPEIALRSDQNVRNMNMQTFVELRTILMKVISKQFLQQAEKVFDSSLNHCQLSDQLTK